jgi:hypothetical protein
MPTGTHNGFPADRDFASAFEAHPDDGSPHGSMTMAHTGAG